MSQRSLSPLARSLQSAPKAERLGEVADDRAVRLTLVLRPATPIDQRQTVSRDE